MRVLLVFGTTEGQTEKVCRFVADQLHRAGHQAVLINALEAATAPELSDFDAVFIAASLHEGRYQPALIRYVRDHRDAINARPHVFLSVSLAAAGEDEDDVQGLKGCVASFVHDSGWTPRLIHHVAGAFRYTAYNFLKRWAMKYIAYRKGGPTDTSRDYELTDWGELSRFVDDFLTRTCGAQPSASR